MFSRWTPAFRSPGRASLSRSALVRRASGPLLRIRTTGAGVSEARQERTVTSTGKSFATRWTGNETGIARFAQIGPGLARGGEPSQADLKYLHDKGYKTILSFLDNQAESVSVVSLGMKY